MLVHVGRLVTVNWMLSLFPTVWKLLMVLDSGLLLPFLRPLNLLLLLREVIIKTVARVQTWTLLLIQMKRPSRDTTRLKIIKLTFASLTWRQLIMVDLGVMYIPFTPFEAFLNRREVSWVYYNVYRKLRGTIICLRITNVKQGEMLRLELREGLRTGPSLQRLHCFLVSQPSTQGWLTWLA